MALPIALNKDPFLTGGVLDAPDLTVRTAMNKLAWGMPISQKEARRITERQGLEQQSINVAQADAQKQALMGLSNVNVGSYAGSMWSPQGSYTAPRANQETIADLLLKQRFGTFEQGQVRGTINPQGYAAAVAAGPNTGPVTTPSMAPMTQPSPIPKASAINSVMGLEGMENILPQTPTAQGYGGVAQGIPSATQASPSVRTVSAVPQMGTPQLPPALQQLLGGQKQVQQPSYQQSQYPAGSALAATTPSGRMFGLQQQEFGLRQTEFEQRQQQQNRQVEIAQNDQRLLAEELAPYMPNAQTGQAGRPINQQEIRNVGARLLARGLSEGGAQKLDTMLKMIGGKDDTANLRSAADQKAAAAAVAAYSQDPSANVVQKYFELGGSLEGAAHLKAIMPQEQAKPSTWETTEGGITYKVYRQPDGTVTKAPQIPIGYTVAKDGSGIVPLAGSAEAVKREQEQKTLADRIDSQKENINNTIKTIDDAIALSQQGAGGTFEGLPVVRNIAGVFGGDVKKLSNKLDTIRSALKIEMISEMKSLSKTGSTGFGQLSEKEGAALEENIAKLSESMDEADLQHNLRTIKNYLIKMRGRSDKSNRVGNYIVTEAK